MVGTGKLLAAGHVTSHGLTYISGRLPVSPPLARRFLENEDVLSKNKNRSSRIVIINVFYDVQSHILRRSVVYPTTRRIVTSTLWRTERRIRATMALGNTLHAE